MTELVWYVAYGSNLSRARLQEYLDRGPDPSPPRDDRPLTIGHPLFFAGRSKVWTGGRAYVDHVALLYDLLALAFHTSTTSPPTPRRRWPVHGC